MVGFGVGWHFLAPLSSSLQLLDCLFPLATGSVAADDLMLCIGGLGHVVGMGFFSAVSWDRGLISVTPDGYPPQIWIEHGAGPKFKALSLFWAGCAVLQLLVRCGVCRLGCQT
ncbi:hypothetical protein Nepgr_033548 [Nepenthes gracilis]|uniref:Uncharacterized protein n=1 Tax=Nepenthes gracilis TaxID=150966 RepID=A0AAD3TM21_NEPGR|nr:hypothetical protein Nepgr_033548 [Nepenthes gracilis]